MSKLLAELPQGLRGNHGRPAQHESSGRMAPLVVRLLTGLAEVERSLIQERTRESVEHRRRTGGNIGGRPALAEGRKELIKRLRDEGMSYREVAETCGVSLATAHRYWKAS